MGNFFTEPPIVLSGCCLSTRAEGTERLCISAALSVDGLSPPKIIALHV